MAGRMGTPARHAPDLTVHAVDAERGLLLIKGAVPGRRGGLVLVRSAAKPAASRKEARARERHYSGPARAAGTVELPDEIFDATVNVPLIHQVVVAQQAAARQGTHATKTRGEVRGGGKKPYRQKGTGRARQGSIRAPQFAGGGVVHGPVPRSYEQRTPKKMKAAALRGALSDRARHGRVHVVERVRRRRRAEDQGRARGAGVRDRRAPAPRSVLVVVATPDDGRPGRACATCPACT